MTSLLAVLAPDEHEATRRLLLDAYGNDQPRGAFAEVEPCRLVAYHAPRPVMTEYHHQHPVFLQNRLYGAIVDPPSLWVCSNCHDSIHSWLYWLLRMHKQPPWIGRAAAAEAQATFDWYVSEARRLAKVELLIALELA